MSRIAKSNEDNEYICSSGVYWYVISHRVFRVLGPYLVISSVTDFKCLILFEILILNILSVTVEIC